VNVAGGKSEVSVARNHPKNLKILVTKNKYILQMSTRDVDLNINEDS
jgi:hypothetical protein